MEKCLFCSISDKNKIILENEYFYSILDIFPVSVWHTLIIPKRHIVSIEELNENEYKAFFVFLNNVLETIKKIDFKIYYENILNNNKDEEKIVFIKNILEKNINYSKIEDYNLWINNWMFAWRTINHLHIHIIPRFKWDVEDFIWWIRHIIPKLWNYKNKINKKLVRDNIPNIMISKWQEPIYYIAWKEKYKKELYNKLLEESKEVIEEKDNKYNLKEELWDLFEVFESILKLEKISFEEIRGIQNKKRKDRWWFKDRIILNNLRK